MATTCASVASKVLLNTYRSSTDEDIRTRIHKG